jgi:hypothetical protein
MFDAAHQKTTKGRPAFLCARGALGNSIPYDASGSVTRVASTPYTASYELCCSFYSLTVNLLAADGICSDIEGRPCLWEHEHCR